MRGEGGGLSPWMQASQTQPRKDGQRAGNEGKGRTLVRVSFLRGAGAGERCAHKRLLMLRARRPPKEGAAVGNFRVLPSILCFAKGTNLQTGGGGCGGETAAETPRPARAGAPKAASNLVLPAGGRRATDLRRRDPKRCRPDHLFAQL